MPHLRLEIPRAMVARTMGADALWMRQC